MTDWRRQKRAYITWLDKHQLNQTNLICFTLTEIVDRNFEYW